MVEAVYSRAMPGMKVPKLDGAGSESASVAGTAPPTVAGPGLRPSRVTRPGRG